MGAVHVRSSRTRKDSELGQHPGQRDVENVKKIPGSTEGSQAPILHVCIPHRYGVSND